VEWELEQVCKTWGKGKDRQQLSQVDQEALGCLVLRVQGHIVSNTSHTLCTPFPTLLSSSVWIDTQTWYTCSVRWALPPDIQNMLSIIGKQQDAKIAETMLQQKTVFWVPRDTWAEWATSHHLTDSDGLSDSARMSMTQQSSWFGVCIETSSIVSATST